MNKEKKKLFKCLKCSWSSETFFDFMDQITNSEVDIDTTITPINILNKEKSLLFILRLQIKKLIMLFHVLILINFLLLFKNCIKNIRIIKIKIAFFYVMEEF